MDFHLDRQLRLLTEPEHKNLYSWAINEIDGFGVVVGGDQIPWSWTLSFIATEIVLSDRIELEETEDAEDAEPFSKRIGGTAHRSLISAKLSPFHGDDWFRHTTYRMFGSDRAIKDFRLNIQLLKSNDEPEICSAWGAVSYTSEIDFRDETIEDCIIFHLRVKPITFERYEQKMIAGTISEIVFSVSRVSGFYSEWSPSISTREIKVLTHGKEHNVQVPDGHTFSPPCLGSIGEAELYIGIKNEQLNNFSKSIADLPDDEDQTNSSAQLNTADAPSVHINTQLVKLLAALNSSSRWLIFLLVSLLGIILLK